MKECDLFCGLDEALLEKVARASLARTVKKNGILFHQGDKAEGFYIIDSGRIKVYKQSPSGREHILHVFGPGDLVAEAAVFDQKTFPANAAAMEDSKVLFLFRAEFLRLLSENPELVFKILSGITRKLRDFAATIEELSLKDVTARLARFVLENITAEGNRKICRLDMSKSQLAARLGTVNETLSRTLGKFKARGVLAETKEGLVVLDESTLSHMIEGGS